MIILLLHLANSDAVKVDCEDMPNPSDQFVAGRNPRDKADKEVTWLEDGVTTVLFPWWRITFVEILPSEEDEAEFPLPFRTD
jgi:hypothetical protein